MSIASAFGSVKSCLELSYNDGVNGIRRIDKIKDVAPGSIAVWDKYQAVLSAP